MPLKLGLQSAEALKALADISREERSDAEASMNALSARLSIKHLRYRVHAALAELVREELAESARKPVFREIVKHIA